MKNNKGFTLVELLAVVAILILILSLITPKIFKQLTTAGKVTDQEQINAIIDTSKLYMNQHSELLPEHNSLYVITLNELKESGLIKTSQILNPSTKEELTGCVVVNYENNKYKYEYKQNNCDKQVVVTFDPQGGHVDKTTKVVTTTETYGELPTPTREGYTFMGWNGNSLFSSEWEQGLIDGNSGTNVNNNDNIRTKDYISVTPNEHYAINRTITTNYMNVRGYDINKNYIGLGASVIDLIQGSTNSNPMSATLSSCVISPKENIYYLRFNDVSNNLETKYMMTLGDSQIEYEPYYITSDTTVVQDKNHTLKAIWQANS